MDHNFLDMVVSTPMHCPSQYPKKKIITPPHWDRSNFLSSKDRRGESPESDESEAPGHIFVSLKTIIVKKVTFC